MGGTHTLRVCPQLVSAISGWGWGRGTFPTQRSGCDVLVLLSIDACDSGCVSVTE